MRKKLYRKIVKQNSNQDEQEKRQSMSEILSSVLVVQKRRKKALLALMLVLSLLLSTIMSNTNLFEVFGSESSPMIINIDEFSNQSQLGSYYSWRGKVTLTGTIPKEKLQSEYMSIYLDEYIEPIIKIEKVDMTSKSDTYSFSINFDTSLYENGYHQIILYDGIKHDTKPIKSFKAYFSQKPYAFVFNVNISCNMRKKATTISDVVYKVKLNEPVDVLSVVKGQFRNEYDTDLWYHVIYTDTKGVEYSGYIISALVSVNPFEQIEFSAQGSHFEDFSSDKREYNMHISNDTNIFVFDSIVRSLFDDKVEVNLNSKSYTGDTRAIPLINGNNSIQLTCGLKENKLINTYTFNIFRIADEVHSKFLTALSSLPESYKEDLLVLHSMYPNWVFQPFDTGLEWEEVINGEDNGYISLIGISNPDEYKFDEIIADSSSFVRASREAVKYYIDPRNFLNEKNIFMFEQLSYHPDIHKLAGIKKILDNCGLKDKEEMFLEAAVDSGVSPYHLAARSKQEVTAWNPIGLSPIARGDYVFKVREKDSATITLDNRYSGLYNFYNIGTGSSTAITVLYCKGLDFAKGNKTGGYFSLNDTEKNGAIFPPREGEERTQEQKQKYDMPWDSEQRAITGGAKYLGGNYINIGQDTPYLIKFDLVGSLFTHQYEQNIQAPLSMSTNTYNSYKSMDVLENNFVFKIPVFKNMPEKKSPNPRLSHKLEKIYVEGYPLTPAFSYNITSGYIVNVPADVEQINLKGDGISSESLLEGTGIKELIFGENLFEVVCSSAGGLQTKYSITVIRNLPEKSSDNYLTSLEVKDFPLDRKFSFTDTKVYTVKVPYETTTIKIIATPRSDTAVVSGIGNVSLSPGINNFKITVKAENNKSRDYPLLIERVVPRLTSDALMLQGGNISGVSISTDVKTLKKSLKCGDGTIEVYDKNNKLLSDTALLGTGNRVKLKYGNKIFEEYIVVIYGDISGDGMIDSLDIALIIKQILRQKQLEKDFLAAADVSGDGAVDSLDLAILIRHVLKQKEIQQLKTN